MVFASKWRALANVTLNSATVCERLPRTTVGPSTSSVWTSTTNTFVATPIIQEKWKKACIFYYTLTLQHV